MRLKKQLLALGLAITVSLNLGACGAPKDSQVGTNAQVMNAESNGDYALGENIVYQVQSETEFKNEENTYYSLDMGIYVDDNLFLMETKTDPATHKGISQLIKYEVENGEMKRTDWKLAFSAEDSELYCLDYCMDQDNNIYALVGETDFDEAEEKQDSTYYLTKYTIDGQQLLQVDITDYVDLLNGRDFPDGTIEVDGQQNVCICSDKVIYVYDSNGEPAGKFDAVGDVIFATGHTVDGRVFISTQNYNNGNMGLYELDLKKNEIINTLSDYNGTGFRRLSFDANGNILAYNMNKLYLYNIESQENTEVLDWMACNIKGFTVRKVEQTADGKLLLFCKDWDKNFEQIVVLEGKDAKDIEITEKEKVVVGCIYSAISLRNSIAEFNKKHDDIQVELKNYIDELNWTEHSYEDGIAAMNADIATGHVLDMVVIDDLDYGAIAKQGVFEDLNPYIQKSDIVRIEDYNQNFIDSMVIDGKRISVPMYVSLEHLVGKKDVVGDKSGLSLGDIIACAKANPDKQLFPFEDRESITQMLLSYAYRDFVDFETGECHFDDEGFKEALSYLKTCNVENGSISYVPAPLLMEDDQLVLLDAYITNFYDVQVIRAELQNDPMTFVGYPGVGGNGCNIRVRDSYSICANSQNKDNAWKFYEYLLSQELQDRFNMGLPTKISEFDKMKEMSLEKVYVIDPETGEPMLDEKGNPISETQDMGTGFMGEDGREWMYTYQDVEQEDVDVLEDIIKDAKVSYNYMDKKILEIITEEAAAFYADQKSIDQVIDIIQNRVSLYIKENQ